MPGLPSTRPAPDLPTGPRAALVVATYTYADPELSQLRAPAHDAADLAGILADRDIGAFAVTSVINQAEPQVRRAIGAFLANRNIGDLVLVYLSCHGLLDRRGRLYFAAADTLKSQLGSTGVDSAWLLDQLDECRARQQILILDCCFSGAFARGSKGTLDLEQRVAGQGRGRAVLTASRAREYSFEGRPVPGAAMTGSVFTAALIDGMRTGAADTDGDGYVSLDEAYLYAYNYVQAHGNLQTPQRWLYGSEGTITLTRSPAGITITPARLPRALRTSLENPYPHVRIGAANALGEWLVGSDPARALAAQQALQNIAETDIPAVAAVARAHLNTGNPATATSPGPGAVASSSDPFEFLPDPDLSQGPYRLQTPEPEPEPEPAPPSAAEEVVPVQVGADTAPMTAKSTAATDSQDATVPAAIRTTAAEGPDAVSADPRGPDVTAAVGHQDPRYQAALELDLVDPAMPAGRPASRSRRLQAWPARTTAAARQPAHLPQRILAGIGLCIVLAILIAADSPHSTPSSASGPAHLEATIGDFSPYLDSNDNGVAFSPDGKTLAVTTEGGKIGLWNLATHTITTTLTDPGNNPIPIGESARLDGDTLAVADNDGNAYLWNLATRKNTATFTGPGSVVSGLGFSPAGNTLAVAAGDTDVTDLWNLATRKRTATLPDPSTGECGIQGIAFSPDGKTLAVGECDGRTYLWNVASHKLTTTLTNQAGSAPLYAGMEGLAFSPDGKILAVADEDGSTYLWNVALRKPSATLIDLAGRLGGEGSDGVAFSPDGKSLAVADEDGSTYLWNVATGKIITSLTDPDSLGVAAVAFSPNGKTLAAADINGNTYLWNTNWLPT